jgi:hypothetical protein
LKNEVKAKRMGTWLKCRALAQQVQGPEFNPNTTHTQKITVYEKGTISKVFIFNGSNSNNDM